MSVINGLYNQILKSSIGFTVTGTTVYATLPWYPQSTIDELKVTNVSGTAFTVSSIIFLDNGAHYRNSSTDGRGHIIYRDGTDNTKGPTFKGYQAKATIATPRQRVIKFPVFCYDVETDKYNVTLGYEGRANDRIGQLESIEENGDIVTWQDLQTGESRQVVIEQITFTRMTPPDRGFSGYGGTIDILVRTV